MNVIKSIVQVYGAAPIFVIFSVLFAVVELTVMWAVVPATAGIQTTQQDLLMDSFLSQEGVTKTLQDVFEVISETNTITNRLDNDPVNWQQPLVVLNPCQKQLVEDPAETVVEKLSDRSESHQFLLEIVDRAISDLKLNSIMKGKNSLANISGSIYQAGDTLLLPNADGSFVVVEVRADSVVLRLVIDDKTILSEFGDIERTLFMFENVNNTYVDAGERN